MAYFGGLKLQFTCLRRKNVQQNTKVLDRLRLTDVELKFACQRPKKKTKLRKISPALQATVKIKRLLIFIMFPINSLLSIKIITYYTKWNDVISTTPDRHFKLADRHVKMKIH